VHGLNRIDGRWDLRGFIFGPAKPMGDSFSFRNLQIDLVLGKTVFNKTSFLDIDLSHAQAADVIWQRCRFENVSFDGVQATDTGFWACQFEQATFDRANFVDNVFAVNIDLAPCCFTNCVFHETDLRGTSHTFTLYRNVTFESANLDEVDFDGARFENCKFTGLIKGVQFRSKSAMSMRGLLTVSKIDTTVFPNKMINVDFSGADLRGVNFSGVDLRSCRFPADDRHLVIFSQNRVFTEVRRKVVDTWTGKYRESALNYLDAMHLSIEKLQGLFLTEAKLKQPIDLVNLDDLIDFRDEAFGRSLFDLIAKTNIELTQRTNAI
jgi:uncharacterized protein YjbI with pentapeptide repeats